MGWEFVTQHLNIPEEKVWVTVYEEDDEAFGIWENQIKIPKERIVRLGKDDNFWEIGIGPCGPCSELYFDRGEEYGCDNPDCKPGCDCDRYLEFWNHVFTQFNRDEEGNYGQLEHKNIDTGMGLERMACIMQGVDTIFDVDTIKHILNTVEKMANVEYGKGGKTDVSIRIITDHIRAVSFLVADGVLPSNEGRGYVLRRLLRRAARHGKLLGIKENFLYKLVDEVIKVSGEAYPELVEKESYIKKVIRIEEEKFNETIEQGMEILASYIADLKKNGETTLSGENAFKLYDTYGFPIDLTQEILEEEHLSIDEEAFNEEMNKQRERARSARGNMDGESWKEDPLSKLDSSVASTFEGYFELENSGIIKAIVKDNELVDSAVAGDKVIVVLDKTTFYPEGGGQAGDAGLLVNKNEDIEELATKVRRYWNLGDGIIGNMLTLLEINGIIVSDANINKKGALSFSQKQTVNGNSRYFVSLGNDKKSACTRNYDLAYELAYIVATEANIQSKKFSKDEFACAFLMPKETFIQDLKMVNDLEDYVELKKKWIVPISAIILRSYQLGEISYKKYMYLMNEMDKKGWLKKEPLEENIKATSPMLLKKSIDVLIDNNIMSKASLVMNLSNWGLYLNQDEVEVLLGFKEGKLTTERNTINNKKSKVTKVNFKSKKR